MFCKENCKSKFTVELLQCRYKIRRGNRIELTCRFVENKNFRLHYHNRCKIEKLLLPAG